MTRRRKALLVAAVALGVGLGSAGIAHSQMATPKPTAKPKATAKPAAKATPKPATKAASVAKPVVATPHHTG